MKLNKLSNLLLLFIVLIVAQSLKAGVIEKPFGIFQGKQVTEYTLTNKVGMQLSIINYGGAITRILTKDKDGNFGDVVTGFTNLEGYLQSGNPYFGALIGRYGNRIAKGSYTIDGIAYQAALNNNGQSLHGGLKGFDKVFWEVEKLSGDSSLLLTYKSVDGEEGYPGNVILKVIYSLSRNNEVGIDYTATTDKKTILNLTNHTYFNLSAGKVATIKDHKLQLKANTYLPVDEVLIPLGKALSVKGTAMDFTKLKTVGKELDQVQGGYDHNWIIDGWKKETMLKTNNLPVVAILMDPLSGRKMTVSTTEPGIQFYSGNFLDGSLTHTKNGIQYSKHAALTLETQHFPDSPHQPGYPSTELKPGETYHQKTVYQFSN